MMYPQNTRHLFSKILLLSLLLGTTLSLSGQTYPSYGPERVVTINGLSFNAMEPFIAPNGQYLFFNNENDGIDTKLYYATRVNDSTFTFVGELNGTNQVDTPYLDAVPDLDSLDNFYWTSTRGYPGKMDNLHHGTFDTGNVTNIGRVRGDFYIYQPGWIVMDHGISYDGQHLYFNNAYFDTCQAPCDTRIGIAQKVDDSTFNMLSNSGGLLRKVNDSSYINYAPCISKGNKELYFTRLPKGPISPDTMVEICVSVRNTVNDTFSPPRVLFSSPLSNIVEAPTLTADKSIMYYHKKVAGVHQIRMRYRDIPSGVNQQLPLQSRVQIVPNPMEEQATLMIDADREQSYTVLLVDVFGRVHRSVPQVNDSWHFRKGSLAPGLYVVQLRHRGHVVTTEKLIIK